ncbi:MAG TPA: LysM peptidoglycan-binding domain-containing protein [Steroidobacteraceae bacterium]|jgi:membrane-bound lytic murein transglycosylase D
MVKVPRISAALLAALASAFAFLAAGCSHLTTSAKSDAGAQTTADTADANAADDDGDDNDDNVVTKVDEAQIKSAGPAQIEDAIEALDAETQGKGPLVRELAPGAAASSSAPSDLFERIRTGFALSDMDDDAIDSEERWFATHPAYLDRTFKRGERYLYHIVNELEARKMPLELALLPVVESAFNPVAYSRARASGLWQFIPDTGRRYGLKQNWYYDGRRDVVAATSAALDYLQALVDEFDGDWLLAIAAYNCGEANVARAVDRNRAAGKPIDFFSLKLPRETRAYVPKLLAMRRIVADPTAHGLAFAPIDNEPYFAKVETAGQIDLHVAAELANVPQDELIALNPAFNHWVTDPDGPHNLLVPADREAQLIAGLANLPPEKRVRVVYHHVRPGDTLGGIADKYGVSVNSLRAANKIRGTMIRPGQDLLVTASPGMTMASLEREDEIAPSTRKAGKHVVRRGDTLWSIAKARGVSMDRLASTNGLKSSETLSVGQVLEVPASATLASTNPSSVGSQPLTYMVRAGDTLSRIAQQFRVSIAQILGWNGLKHSSVIKPGQRLVMYVDDRRRAGI